MDGFTAMGLEKTDAGTAASVCLVALSVLLTGLNLYNKLARYGGAGTLVPITGFANAVAAPAIDFKTEGLVTGMAAKMFTVAGPVIVFGVAAQRALRRDPHAAVAGGDQKRGASPPGKRLSSRVSGIGPAREPVTK